MARHRLGCPKGVFRGCAPDVTKLKCRLKFLFLRERAIACLRRYRLVNPDSQIAQRFALLLEKYVYLRDHVADAFIAATAWEKYLEIVTTNARHVEPVAEIRVRRFPEDWKSDEKKERTAHPGTDRTDRTNSAIRPSGSKGRGVGR